MSVNARPTRLEPAYSIVRKFDREDKRGEYVLAERLGKDRATIAKWTTSKDAGGTGGYIPYRYYEPILTFAMELGVALDPREFVERRKKSECSGGSVCLRTMTT